MEASMLLKEELDMANAVLKLLEPLNERVRLYLITSLTRSVNKAIVEEAMDKQVLLDKVCGAWNCDESTAEDEIKAIREARTQGVTRIIETL